MPEPAGISREGLFCPHCDYDLQGSVADQCPECGEAFDPAELAKSRIPWVHRREIGRVRAYWRTVGMVTFRPGRLCREVSRPVSYGDAQRFRVVTAGLVTLSVWVWFLISIEQWGDGLYQVWDETPEAFIATMIGLAFFSLGITGVHTYWFHPRTLPVEKQNRALALAYYGSAPLALLLGVVPLLLIKSVPFFLLLPIGASVVIGMIGLMWWGLLTYMLRRIAERSWIATASFVVFFPVICAATGAAVVASPLLLTIYVMLMVRSLA